MVKSESTRTRDRLIDTTLEQVAARGFDGVSVGDIEAGAGLAPRSGALYKYFGSKLAVLEAGLERHLQAIEDIEVDATESPIVDAALEIEVMARTVLAELDREQVVTRVIEREGDRLPDLRDRMRAGVSERGYRVAAAFIERWTASQGRAASDAQALSVLLIGGLVNLRRSTWTFGAPPMDLTDDRVVETFVAIGTELLQPVLTGR